MGKQLLRACPFCGRIPDIDRVQLKDGQRKGVYWKYSISCKYCGCSIDMHQTDTIYQDEETAQRNAIEAWNRRCETH